MSFTSQEKYGIIDLLQVEEGNIPILIQIAKSVTKNVVDIATTQEALEYIFAHVRDCVTLLNKRAITKEILFKYLHGKNVSVTGDFTKALLIKKVLSYWNLSSFTSQEKYGIIDLLQVEEGNIPILIQIAKSVTKNVVDIATTQEALEYIFAHVRDCVTLLNKRAITKEILFKYLHGKNVSVTGDFTKALLIKKVLSYWNLSSETSNQDQPNSQIVPLDSSTEE